MDPSSVKHSDETPAPWASTFDCSLMRHSEADDPNEAMPKFLTHPNDKAINVY